MVRFYESSTFDCTLCECIFLPAWMCPYRSDLNRMCANLPLEIEASILTVFMCRINAYNRLVVLSYGFQKAVAEKGVSREDRIVRMVRSLDYYR